MAARWSRDRRWSGVGRIVSHPAATDPGEVDPGSKSPVGGEDGRDDLVQSDAQPDEEFVGVGDVRMVRTFRVGADGGLYPVNSATAWAEGWNTASCLRNARHHAPEAQCRCGFYAYSDPAYVREQPPARSVLAVVAAHGTMETGTRGARVEHARIEALWFGQRVNTASADAVRRRYPSVAIYRDRREMDAAHPLTQLEYFRPPRVAEAARERLRRGMWTFLAAVTAIGCIPTAWVLSTVPGAVVWLTLIALGMATVLTGVGQRSAVLAMQGVAAVGWLVTASPATASGWAGRLTLVLMMVWVMRIWWSAATPGRVVRASRVERFFRHLRGRILRTR